jgi:hypothetical protein
MIPNVNFNPSFANLTALRGLGMPHPAGPIGAPPQVPMPTSALPQTSFGVPPQAPMQQAPIYPGMPAQPGGVMPGPMPQGNLGNLQALIQLLGQRGAMQQ